MTASNLTYGIKNTVWVYNVVSICLVVSLVFWPLISSLLIIFLSAYWLFFVKKDFNFHETRSKLVILFCLLYLPVIIGTFYSSDMEEAMAQLRIKSPLLAIPIVFGCTLTLNTRIYHNILRSFAGFTFAGCIFCISAGVVQNFKSGSTNNWNGYELVILKDMPPFILAFFCLVSLAYILNEVYDGEVLKRSHKIIASSLVIFFSIFMLLLGNRNMLLCWIIVIIYFCFLLIPGLWKRALFIFFLFAILFTAVILNPSLNKQWNDLSNFSENNKIQLDADKSLARDWGGKAIRIAIWQCSAEIIKKNWLTGVGTGDVQYALQDAYERRQFYFASRHNMYNAHNQFIQETIAFGITGLCIFVLCILIPVISFIRHPEYRLYILFLLCFAIICITESILETSKGVIFYALLNSLFAFTKRPDSVNKQPSTSGEG